MCDHRLKLWNTMPSRVRIRSTCLASAGRVPCRPRVIRISSPPTRTSPESGVSSRLMQRRSVLLPEPDEPIIAITSPFWALSDTPLRTSSWPKRLCSSMTTRAAAAPFVPSISPPPPSRARQATG